MSREPSIAPPPVIRTTTLVEEVRRYKVITPIFGGGGEPSFSDPVTLIRGSSVRGSLRFWWRATRGGSNLSDRQEQIADMRSREAQVWGLAADAAGPSQSAVNLRVRVDEFGKDVRHGDPQLEAVGYALFPMRPQEGEAAGQQVRKGEHLREGVTFTLTLTYRDKVYDDVQAALWAWETFGGIGARTRRGCGALQCVERIIVRNGEHKSEVRRAPQSKRQAQQELSDGIKHHVLDATWPAGTPHLSQVEADCKLTGPHKTPLAAWGHLIGSLKTYRQQRQGKKGYGRSLWPEPDTVRQRMIASYPGGVLPASRARLTTVEKFPRGQFGLPIVFHLKGEPSPQKPINATLQGEREGMRRLASPLILRPIALDNGTACGLAVILAGRVNIPVVLTGPPAPTPENVRWTAREMADVQKETALGSASLDAGVDPVRHFFNSWLKEDEKDNP